MSKVWNPYLLLLDANELIMHIEMHGMVYDVVKAADLYEAELLPEMQKTQAELQERIENPIYNPGSSMQNSALYYDKWHVSHDMQYRPDKARSCDESALEEIIAGRFQIREELQSPTKDFSEQRQAISEFSTKLLRWRKVQKQASTYIISMIERALLDPDHRVYTEILLHGTNSGRLSSRNPNLQNITRDKEDLPSIRSLFRASPGRVIVQADYSQAELRAIASFSGDEKLCGIYREGLDLHAIAARNFYGDNFKKEERSKAKNMNFGVAYRQGAATFQEKHGIPEGEAQQFIDWWWQEFSGVARWEKEIENRVRKEGTLISPYGRRRRFYLLTRDNIQAAYREAINFYPQTTASDFTLRSAIELRKETDPRRACITILVHDSILSDVEEEYSEEYAQTCKEIMAGIPKKDQDWELPFEADLAIGETWGTVKEI